MHVRRAHYLLDHLCALDIMEVLFWQLLFGCRMVCHTTQRPLTQSQLVSRPRCSALVSIPTVAYTVTTKELEVRDYPLVSCLALRKAEDG